MITFFLEKIVWYDVWITSYKSEDIVGDVCIEFLFNMFHEAYFVIDASAGFVVWVKGVDPEGCPLLYGGTMIEMIVKDDERIST